MAKNNPADNEDDNLGQGTDFESGEGETIDLSGVEEGAGFEVVPKGVYDVIVDVAEYKLSGAGNPMFALQLVLENSDYAGRKVFTNLTFTEKALPMVKRALKALGSELIEGPFVPNQESADSLVGKRARAQVSIEKYEGEDTNRVKNLKPALGDGDVLGDGE